MREGLISKLCEKYNYKVLEKQHNQIFSNLHLYSILAFFHSFRKEHRHRLKFNLKPMKIFLSEVEIIDRLSFHQSIRAHQDGDQHFRATQRAQSLGKITDI